MLRPPLRAALLPALVVAALAGCAPDAAEETAGEPAAATPGDPARAAAAPAGSKTIYELVVTGADGFRAEGWIEEGQILSIADEEGRGLAFRPLGAEPQSDGPSLVSIEVVTLHGDGAGETSQKEVASVKVPEGGSGSVDPGDGEGSFRVEVASVSQP